MTHGSTNETVSGTDHVLDAGGLVKRPVLIAGVQRSGTTLLGGIVATFSGAEYEFEPRIFEWVPLLHRSGGIDHPASLALMRGAADEFMRNHLMCRSVNMRPGESSNKAERIGERELLARYAGVRGVADVRRRVEQGGARLVLKVVNPEPSLGLLFDAFPDMRLVQIIRNPFDTAFSLAGKGWFGDGPMQAGEVSFMRREGPQGRVPWWVPPGREDRFFRFSTLERSLWFCIRMAESRQRFEPAAGLHLLRVRYEELLLGPEETVRGVAEFAEMEMAGGTASAIAAVRASNLVRNAGRLPDGIAPELVERAVGIMRGDGYDADAFLSLLHGQQERWMRSLRRGLGDGV